MSPAEEPQENSCLPFRLDPKLKIHRREPFIRYRGRLLCSTADQHRFLRLCDAFNNQTGVDLAYVRHFHRDGLEQDSLKSFTGFVRALNKALLRELGYPKMFRISGKKIRLVERTAGFGLEALGGASDSAEAKTPQVRNRQPATHDTPSTRQEEIEMNDVNVTVTREWIETFCGVRDLVTALMKHTHEAITKNMDAVDAALGALQECLVEENPCRRPPTESGD